MTPMSAAWGLLKALEYQPRQRIGQGAYRSVYPAQFYPDDVVKVPHGGAPDFIDMAHSNALAEAGEPVIPEIAVGASGGGEYPVPAKPSSLQQRMPGTVSDVLWSERGRDMNSDESLRIREAMDDLQRRKNTYTGLSLTDLHAGNLSLPPKYFQEDGGEIGDTEQIMNDLRVFDGMSRFRGGDLHQLLSELHQKDPEKTARVLELMRNRKQFDPWMDKFYHTANNSTSSPEHERQVKRQLGLQYAQYIRLMNEAKRIMSMINDPYQTQLTEFDETDIVPRPTAERAYFQQQAKEGLVPYEKPVLQSIDDERRSLREALKDAREQQQASMARNDRIPDEDLDRELVRLLGPTQTRRLMENSEMNLEDTFSEWTRRVNRFNEAGAREAGAR
jgi:hypothetical protein